MTRFKIAFFIASLAATAAFAHEDVQNPTVKERMKAMETIGANMKILAGMARGQTTFDADAANAALAIMATTAATVPGLFEAREDDPTSEAADEIWTNWDDFVAKADALTTAANAAAGSVVDTASLGTAMGAVGGTCKSCHQEYKL